ncbi:hypothetical protein D3C85_1741340 [compost metagenome]
MHLLAVERRLLHIHLLPDWQEVALRDLAPGFDGRQISFLAVLGIARAGGKGLRIEQLEQIEMQISDV